MKHAFLNILRERTSDCSTFRLAAGSLSALVANEIGEQFLSEGRIVLVAILRAGIAMLTAFENRFCGAPIGFLGIRRDEKTALPHLYYEKLPSLSPTDQIFVLDPMIATGGSANLALDQLIARGADPSRIVLVSILSAPEGRNEIHLRHPDVRIYTVAIDQGLDAKKFIIPGLGDFGDRYFGTD